MIRSGTTGSVEEAKLASLDMWLSFDRDTNAQYELENGVARAEHLRHTIFIGLILYNIYNLTGWLLMPDILWPSVVLRVLVVTPFSIGLAFLVFLVRAELREWLVAIGSVNAYAIPVFLFWFSENPLGTYSFGEFGLTLVFGNMLLALRFRQAVFFTSCAFGITLCGLLLHATLDPALLKAFTLQSITACIFTLYGNYLIEKRRCKDFVTARIALIRANKAERSQKQLTKLSRTDALTGLPNRRYLDETLDQWLDGSASVAVLMIDVDHFKLFNDALGHPAGDDCLRQLAQAFLEKTEQPDSFSARFGGEEFTIAVRDVDEIEAVRLAHQLVQSIAALNITHPGRHDGIGVVTVSIGVTITSSGHGTNKEVVLSNADIALYRAKKNGRNSYAFHGQNGDPKHATG
jgi:diguanylate cyclase (GGDEF)-like protein